MGRYKGEALDPVASEADHDYCCPQCGEWVDMRNLGEVFEHEQPHEQRPDTSEKNNHLMHLSLNAILKPL